MRPLGTAVPREMKAFALCLSIAPFAFVAFNTSPPLSMMCHYRLNEVQLCAHGIIVSVTR